MRSFKVLPPTHVIRLTSFAMLPNRELTQRVSRFLERLRYRIPSEYLLVNEWSDGHRHMHLLVRADGDISPALVGELWGKLIPGPKGIRSTYCRPVKNPAGAARYIVKHVGDAGKKEVAPKTYRGRVMTYSREFLSESMESLWRDELRDWNLQRRSGPEGAEESSPGRRK
jgi:hypothetical protein